MTVERSCEIILNDGAIDLHKYDNKTEYSSGSLMSNVFITDLRADNIYLKTYISSKPTPTLYVCLAVSFSLCLSICVSVSVCVFSVCQSVC